MTEELHIASLIVRVRPERVADLKCAIGAISGAEIAAEGPAGKLIVTLESRSERAIAHHLEAFAAMPGVIAATLVVHHVASGLPEQEEVPP